MREGLSLWLACESSKQADRASKGRLWLETFHLLIHLLQRPCDQIPTVRLERARSLGKKEAGLPGVGGLHEPSDYTIYL
jgi:hypothetical protein